jgi:hypothetical protein
MGWPSGEMFAGSKRVRAFLKMFAQTTCSCPAGEVSTNQKGLRPHVCADQKGRALLKMDGATKKGSYLAEDGCATQKGLCLPENGGTN